MALGYSELLGSGGRRAQTQSSDTDLSATLFLSLPEERRVVGGDKEGIDTHAVLLEEDPISEKHNSRIAQSDLDTLNDYSLRARGPATRAYRFLNA